MTGNFAHPASRRHARRGFRGLSNLNTGSPLAVTPLVLGLGMQELLVLLLILILLFGASKLPQIGRGMGEGIRNFKKGMKGDEEDREIEDGTAKPD